MYMTFDLYRLEERRLTHAGSGTIRRPRHI